MSKPQGSYRKGMNQKFRIKEFEIKENKDGVPYLQIIFTDSDKRRKFYWFGSYKKGGFVNNEYVESPEAGKEDNDRLKKDIKEIMAALVGMPAVTTALSISQEKGWAGFLNTMKSILPDNYQSIDLDVFLRYQWKMDEGQERTYLEVPKNSKHGDFIASATTGDYNKFEDPETGLKYLDQKLREHPFTRSDWWVSSNFNNAQGVTTKEGPSIPPAKSENTSADFPTTKDEPKLTYDDDLPF